MPSPSPGSHKQATLSHYFKPLSARDGDRKRASSPIDLTGEDAEPPLEKRPRVLDAPDSHSTQATSSGTAKERWKYAPSSSDTAQRLSRSKAARGGDRKRVSSPIDLTGDNAKPPSERRSRVLDVPDSHSTSSSTMKERWKYAPSSPDTAQRLSQSNDAAEEPRKKRRREAFKKKLLESNSIFLRRKSTSNCSETPSDAEQDRRDRKGESGSDSDNRFKALTAVFARDTKGKGKSAVKDHSQRPKKDVEVGPSGQPYTPLELQVLQLKKSNPGTMIMVEVGYKYRIFGEDARAAANALGIACFTLRNFLTASFPTHRLGIHLKKLLSEGHRVGIVSQTETAALKKVGNNRGGPFDRKLTHLYTAATYVDELNSVDDLERYSPPPLMCLIEEPRGGMGADERASMDMVAVCPSTGDVVWDEFDDNHMRSELETRMIHLNPAEMLLPSDLSKPTERLLDHFSKSHTGSRDLRIERFNDLMSYSASFAFISEFFTETNHHGVTGEAVKPGELMARVTGFPRRVTIALAHAMKYLSNFGLADVLLEMNFFVRFTSRAHMLLNSSTLTNLEIFCNETDHRTNGSLMWILDRTKTKFGARLLKRWVGKPLVDVGVLQERVDAVEEIISSTSEKLVSLRGVLKNLPDLAKGLCRIQYGKCTPQELAVLLPAFSKIGNAFEIFDSPSHVGCKSRILNDIIASFPRLKEPMKQILGDIVLKSAAQGDEVNLWSNTDKYPVIFEYQMSICGIEAELEEELKSIQRTLKRPSLKWKTVLGDEYLVEVKKNENALVPDTWMRVSATKSMERYLTPVVKSKVQEREQYRETLQAEAHRAFLSFLSEIVSNYYSIMRNAVNNLAIADCLLSFALTAMQDGYVKPQFTEDDILEIVDGRHPMIEVLRSDPFVPNTVRMGNESPRNKIITGPNMGGKSSSVRMVALIAIMAQIGSYVPATSVRIRVLDSILTRMGASDNLARGRSTFMVEMSETRDILQTATSNSLVILDELGRGTSTVDGMAVANAVMHHLIEVTKCKTLFITHYPLIASDLEKRFPCDVQNLHMGYTAETGIDGKREITFLYHLILGAATESFGIECARLAGVPETVLEVAAERSRSFSHEVERRVRKRRALRYAKLLAQYLARSKQPQDILTELEALHASTLTQASS